MAVTLHVLHGVPGSGKSTLVERNPELFGDFVQVERDQIRERVFGREYLFNPVDKAKEATVTKIQHGLIHEALSQGKNVVSSDTNLNPRALKDLNKIAHKHGAHIEQHYMELSLEEALRRNANRERNVPEFVIRNMYDRSHDENGRMHRFVFSKNGNVFVLPRTDEETKFFDQHNQERLAKFPQKTNAIVVDVDGTLAKNQKDAERFLQGKKKQWGKFFSGIKSAEPNEDVVESANRLAEDTNSSIVVLTGRSGAYREELVSFLEHSGLNYSRVIAKRKGDYRPSSEFKAEVLDEMEAEQSIIHAFDDDPKSAQVFKNRGISVSIVDNSGEEPMLNKAFESGVCVKCHRPLRDGSYIGPVCVQKA